MRAFVCVGVCACVTVSTRDAIRKPIFFVWIAIDGKENKQCQNDVRVLDLHLENEIKVQRLRNVNWPFMLFDS